MEFIMVGALLVNHCVCLGVLFQAGDNLQPVPREDQEEDD